MIHFTAANAREKKSQHNTSIENNSLLLGLCTYISFVWLFFCLSHYPGGIIRSLQAETHQLRYYILWFLSISHKCRCTGFVPYLLIFRFPKLHPSAGQGAELSPGVGGGEARWAPARRKSVAPLIHPPSVTRQMLTRSACTYIQE